MAQGYGIGMSSRPLDLASGGLSFYQSAVQARRQEIKDHMVEASENEKMMLKAMDMKGLGEVAGKSRDRLDGEIQKFRSEMVEKYRKNQGKLSNADRTWLEGRSVDIQNNITATKNQLQALEKAKLMVTPDKWASFNDHVALGQQLAKAEDAIAAGDRTVNPLNIVMQNFRTPTAAEMISARYKDPLSKIDRSKITTVKGRTATINDAATEESLNQLYGMIAKDPQVAQQFIMRDEKGNPVVDANGQTIMDKELALNTILPMIQDKTEIRPATRSEMGIYGSVGATPKTFTTEVFKAGDQTFNKGMSVSLKNKFYNPAGDSVYADTGEPASQTVDVGAGVRFNADENNPVMVYDVKEAAPLKKSGKVVYDADGQNLTEDQIMKDPSLAAGNPYGSDYKASTPKIQKAEDGSITITPVGVLKEPQGAIGKFFNEKAPKKEFKPVVIQPKIDPQGSRQIITKITPNNIGPVFDAIGRNSMINGERAGVLEERIKKAFSSGTKSSNGKKSIEW